MAATEAMEMKTIARRNESEVLEVCMQKERKNVLMGLLYAFGQILYSKRKWAHSQLSDGGPPRR
jgi:hypothetical protein